MKKISVVIPIYNVEKYLEQCIQSVINQTYKNIEIILVDDGSTDSSGNICDRFEKEDNRIIFFHQSNKGLSDARNKGLKHAKGEYISFLDSDDYICENMLETLYGCLESTECDMAICGIEYIDADGEKLYKKRNYKFENKVLTPDEFWKIYATDGHTECVLAANKLYTRAALQDIWYPIGKVREDEFVIHRIINNCRRLITVSDCLLYYRQNENSIMANKTQKRELNYIEACFDRLKFFEENNNLFMLEDTVIRLISSIERYHLEFDEDYEEWKIRIKEECQKVKKQIHFGRARIIIELYDKNLLPYRIIHKVLCILKNEKEK